MCEKLKRKKQTKKIIIFILPLLLLTFILLIVFGCEEPLQATRDLCDAACLERLTPEAVRIIRQGLVDADPRIRVKAVEVVAAAQQKKLMPEVSRLLKDDFVPVRFAAALAVGDMKYSNAGSSVRQLLKDPDENVKIAAAYAAAKLGAPDKINLIRTAIAGKNKTVRANATMLLGKNGDKSDLKPLYWAIKDEDSDDKVRFQAVEAIAKLGDERIYRKIWTMLISAYADDRVMGIKSMGALGTVRAKEALLTMLDDDVPEVRISAAEQLGMLGCYEGQVRVIEVFTQKSTADLDEAGPERINMLAALAIGQIGTPAVTKFLPQLLKNESKRVRIAAAKAVFQCKTGN